MGGAGLGRVVPVWSGSLQTGTVVPVQYKPVQTGIDEDVICALGVVDTVGFLRGLPRGLFTTT